MNIRFFVVSSGSHESGGHSIFSFVAGNADKEGKTVFIRLERGCPGIVSGQLSVVLLLNTDKDTATSDIVEIICKRTDGAIDTIRTPHNTATVKLDTSSMADGQRCGLCHFSVSNAGIGIAAEGARRNVEYRENDSISHTFPIDADEIWLRTEWGLDGLATFSYSLDGQPERENSSSERCKCEICQI